jgi:AAA15 family ATPase/GTPase
MAVDVYKVILSSKKQVLLKKMLIKHQEQAAIAVGDKADNNAILFALLMQKELLKLLIHTVDGKELKDAEKQSLDDLFSMEEYNQLLGVVGEISGNAKQGKPLVELLLSGA